jgi:type I restriction enzyme, S subunit
MSVDELRETHHINRVSPSDIGILLSAQSYRPEITQAIRTIKSFKWASLQELVSNTISPGPHPSYGGDYPCLKTKNVNELLADQEPADYADVKGLSNLKDVQVQRGDLLINLTGAGSIGRVSVYYGKDLPITNQHIARMSIKPDYDEGYVAAFLRTWWGERALEQGVAGSTGQINMVNDHVRSVPIVLLKPTAQKYVGDKVRQAERLRDWAKALEQQLDEDLSLYQPTHKVASSLASKVSPDLLTNMLTATTYRDHYIANQKNLRKIGKTFSLFDLLNSVTNGFDERTELEEGMPYVKVADVKPGYIDLRNAPKVRHSAFADATAKQKPKIGDLLLTRKGSFGIAAVVMECADFLCSSEVFSCKPKNRELMPILAWFLNSTAGNMQFWQFSTGTTMPGINQENLANILIPDFSVVSLDEFNHIYDLRFRAKKHSELLTIASKLLVEALIEGQIDENLLVAAQNLLATGDDSIDRSILNRLKADGVDGRDQALFADLDQLYALLAQAQEA